MFINRKMALSATLLLLSLGRWGQAIGSNPIKERLLSPDLAVQTQALKEITSLTPTEKRLLIADLSQSLHTNAVSAGKAAEALSRFDSGAEPAIPDLVDALNYDEESVFSTVGEALFKAGPEAVPPLRKALSDSNFFVRRRAAEILARFGPKARSAAPELVELLKDPKVEVHAAAENALVQIGEGAVPAVASALRNEDDSNRKLLLETLGRIGKPALPVILRVLRKDENTFVRGAAADALAQMPDIPPEAVSALMETTHDLDEGLRGSAVDALGQTGVRGVAALGSLLLLSHTDQDPLIQSKARQAAEKIGHGTKDSLPGFALGLRQGDVDTRIDILSTLAQSHLPFNDVLPLIVASQKDGNPAVRIKGLQAASLLQGSTAAALQVLSVAMSDPQPEVRSASIQELGRLKQDAPAAANALGAGLKDPNPALRHQAIEALSGLGPPAVPFLILELKDDYIALSDEAGKAILKQGAEAIPALEAAAAGPDAVLSKKAADLLKRFHRKRSHKS